MLNCIIIFNNEINELKVRNISKENLYKKCNYKNNNDFVLIKTWDYSNNVIEMWGKNKSNYNSKNTYVLFEKFNINVYGKALFILKNKEDYLSFNKNDFLNFFNIQEQSLTKSNDKQGLETGLEKGLEKELEKELKDVSDYESDNESINSELTYELYSYSDE